jgi:hypothetical protein
MAARRAGRRSSRRRRAQARLPQPRRSCATSSRTPRRRSRRWPGTPAGGCAAVAYFGGVCLWDADDAVAQKEFAYGNGIQALAWSPGRPVARLRQPGPERPPLDARERRRAADERLRDQGAPPLLRPGSRWLATSGSQDACVWDCSGAGPEGREPVMLPHAGAGLRRRLPAASTACSPPRPRTAPSCSGAPSGSSPCGPRSRCRRRHPPRLVARRQAPRDWHREGLRLRPSVRAMTHPTPSSGCPGPLWQSLGLTLELAGVTTASWPSSAFPWRTGSTPPAAGSPRSSRRWSRSPSSCPRP